MEVKFYKEITDVKSNGILRTANEDQMFIADGGTVFSIRKSGSMIKYGSVDEVYISLRSVELLDEFKVKSFEVNGITHATNNVRQRYHMNHGPWSLGFCVNYDGTLAFIEGATNVKK